MRRLDHCNIVSLLYFFYTSGEKKDEIYLNLVLEYIPETVYKVARQYSKQKQTIPVTFIKLYMYQLFRLELQLVLLSQYDGLYPQVACLHPLSRDLSSRHQTSEPSARP